MNAIAKIITLGIAAAGCCAALGASSYRLTATIPLGPPDRWDYAVLDPVSERLYVAHADRLTVVNGRTAKLIGDVPGIVGGTHGTAISTASGQGFTDDGRGGLAVVFDPATLQITRRIPVAEDADGMTLDDATGRVFVVSGDPGTVSVINPRTDRVVATVKVGEKLEYPAGDGRGAIYVAGEERGDLVRVDARAAAVTARWPLGDCASPHGVAIDAAGGRAFVGCINGVLAVVDIASGRVIARLAIGRGSDAVVFDPKRHRIFSSNGADGTISVYQQRAPDLYEALPPIATAVSGRTMALDPKTGRLFVIAADTEPSAIPGGRPRPRPGTLKVLVFDPVD